jgi:hypothetical protein
MSDRHLKIDGVKEQLFSDKTNLLPSIEDIGGYPLGEDIPRYTASTYCLVLVLVRVLVRALQALRVLQVLRAFQLLRVLQLLRALPSLTLALIDYSPST